MTLPYTKSFLIIMVCVMCLLFGLMIGFFVAEHNLKQTGTEVDGFYIGGNVICYEYDIQNPQLREAHEEVHALINGGSKACGGYIEEKSCYDHFCGVRE